MTAAVDNESAVHAALLYYKARALRLLGLDVAARDALTAALRRSKDRPDELLLALRYERADVYEALGRRAQARKDLERIYAADPGYEDVAARLGV
jgi:tetratricopeptide (TPR) repeat protein